MLHFMFIMKNSFTPGLFRVLRAMWGMGPAFVGEEQWERGTGEAAQRAGARRLHGGSYISVPIFPGDV